MNTTANGSNFRTCSSLINPEEPKIGQTVALSLILVVSLVGNSLIVLIIYKTPPLRKPINMLIANMAMSDLLYPIFWVPVHLAKVPAGSWLIGGTLGQALCKLHLFLSDISSLVSIHSLVLITVDRFVAVVVPLRSPLISRKLTVSVLHCRYVDRRNGRSFAIFCCPDRLMCERLWKEAFGGNTYPNYFLAGAILFFYTPFIVLVILYSIIMIKLKKQVHPGEQSANAEEQRTRRNRNVLKMATAIMVVFFICWIPFSINAIIVSFSAPDSLVFSSCSFYLYHIVLLTRLSALFLAVTIAKLLRDL